MLRKNPQERISAEDALSHPFFDSGDADEDGDVVVPLAKAAGM
jgi:serine/threonine protein kinase